MKRPNPFTLCRVLAGIACLGSATAVAPEQSASFGAIPLRVLPDRRSPVPTGMNDAGRVPLVCSCNGGIRARSFLWAGDELRPIGELRSGCFRHAAIYCYVEGPALRIYARTRVESPRAFLVETKAELNSLENLGGLESQESDPDDVGQVVGSSRSPRPAPRAVSWESGAWLALDGRVVEESAAKLQVGRGINPAARTVTHGRRGARARAFLLTPLRE